MKTIFKGEKKMAFISFHERIFFKIREKDAQSYSTINPRD